MENESISQWVDTESLRALAEDLMRPAPESKATTGEEIYGTGFVGFAEADGMPASPLSPLFPLFPLSSPPPPVPSSPEPSAPDPEVREVPAEVGIPSPVASPSEGISDPVPAETSGEDLPEVTLVPVTKSAPSVPTARFESPFRISKAPPLPEAPRRFSPVLPAEAPSLPVPPEPAPPAPSSTRPLSSRLTSFGAWLGKEYPAEAYFICDRHGEAVVDEVGSEKLMKVARTLAHASSLAGKQAGTSGEPPPGLHVRVGPERVMEVIPQNSRFGLMILGILVPRPLSREAVNSVSQALGKALAEAGSAPRE